MSRQSRLNAQYWMLGAGALGWPRGMVQGGRREEGSGWGTCVYLWWIHVDIWQNQCNIVNLNNKIKFKKIIVINSLKLSTPLELWCTSGYTFSQWLWKYPHDDGSFPFSFGWFEAWFLLPFVWAQEIIDKALQCEWVSLICTWQQMEKIYKLVKFSQELKNSLFENI